MLNRLPMPRPQLLGGFAGSSSPNGCKALTFPQVSDAGSGLHARKTAQKSGTHGKIRAHFLRNRPEAAWRGREVQAASAGTRCKQ